MMYVKKIKDRLKTISDKIKFLMVIIPVAGIVISYLQLRDFIKIAEYGRVKFFIYTFLINIAIIYMCNLVYKKEKNIKKLEQENQVLDMKNSTLMELNDSIRCFKHDFYNIIQAIDGYILLGDMEALKGYFSKLLDECNHLKNLEIFTTKAINDPAVYGILLNKYKKAENSEINMNIDVIMDFSNMGKYSYRLSRVLGILLDNAIEASLECNEKEINISFLQSNDLKKKKIVIENTYEDKDIDTKMIYEKEFSTKKGKGNSGLGLWKVKELMGSDKEMWLQTSKDSKYFKQELEIVL